ncbi:MAG: tetratricopeptide repeat protein [Gammaproteobacteria bacterium]|nr:tetratricopeptide repeat protein [Gammaproteobacteria bacterium]
MPAAATGLLRTADQMIERNDLDAALTQLERAQRIAPRSPVVYYKLAEVHVQKGELAKAEQFTLKGISLAGQDRTVARAGWQLLADIRRARGNRQGSAEAQDKARALD